MCAEWMFICFIFVLFFTFEFTFLYIYVILIWHLHGAECECHIFIKFSDNHIHLVFQRHINKGRKLNFIILKSPHIDDILKLRKGII